MQIPGKVLHGIASLHTQAPGKLLHVIASLHPRTPAHLLHVIARSEATWQSVLLRQHKTKSNTLGKYGKAANLPRESVVAVADTPHVSACHCEPVRTLVWQSVSPAAAQTEKQRLWRIRSCLRTHPGTTLLHPRTPAHLLHVIARSGAAAPRRGNPYSCGSTERKAILPGKSVEAANLP